MIRTFISLDTPLFVKEELFLFQSELKKTNADVRWEAKDKFHITLKFLGDVEETKIDSINEIIKKIVANIPSFEISLSDIGCFPNWNEPRVLWIGGEESSGALHRLYKHIENDFYAIGFDKEKRKFFPHITLGRVKGHSGISHLLQTMKSLTFSPQKFVCQDLQLMKSELRFEGSLYSCLQTFPFSSL